MVPSDSPEWLKGVENEGQRSQMQRHRRLGAQRGKGIWKTLRIRSQTLYWIQEHKGASVRFKEGGREWSGATD